MKVSGETAIFRQALLLGLILVLGAGLASIDVIGPTLAASQEIQQGVPMAPEDGGPRVWQVHGVSSGLNFREGPSLSTSVLRRLTAGTILQNLGCQPAEEGIWCYVQALSGGPVGYVAAEFLKPAVGPDGSVPMGEDQSSYRAGQGDFDASGSIPCAQFSGQPMRECPFEVARDSGGYATVVVTKPDGVERAVFFSLGLATGADTSEADGYPEFSSGKEGDLHFIRIGDERYEIPDAVVLGG